MPTLYILAGPNGAGKTTFYFLAIENALIDKVLSFINTDVVVRKFILLRTPAKLRKK